MCRDTAQRLSEQHLRRELDYVEPAAAACLLLGGHLQPQDYGLARTVYKFFGHHDAAEWLSILLHFGYTEEPIKHVIVAVASLHETMEPINKSVTLSKAGTTEGANILALKHYNDAIRHLREVALTMSTKPDVTMVLCLLCMCFEQLRSGDAACFIHLMAALRSLYSWRCNTQSYAKFSSFPRPTSDFINEKITPILQRLRVQFAVCMDQRHISSVVGTSPCLPVPSIPNSYRTFSAARIDYDRIMNYMFSTLDQQHSLESTVHNNELISTLYNWKRALDCSKIASEDANLQVCTRKLLELYYHVSIIVTSTLHADNELVFDAHNDGFQQIVDLAEGIIQVWTPDGKQYRMLFSFDLGLTSPMFLVASRCRQSSLRRRALQIMLHSLTYHGAWRDQYSGLCAQRIIDIEEQGLSRVDIDPYVPESQRIRKVSADIDEENGRIIMQYIYSPFTAHPQMCTTVIQVDG
ncbi:hypothetical protein LTR51_001586 [Lithohypha guttulata]|uniref:Uncharacterized protein n=1 Tax=Lithohypha guttulata TaxID=1690604 RepID=A0AAN7STK6_9EURO|nr:hypothetical protein LTR51_001586 [Lithohypha guttulata]KAK5081001.1 hypothetical protein LTR05_008318 [Lithohypha guttulata]